MSTTPTLIDVYGFTGTICGYWGAHDTDYPPWVETALNNVSYDKIDKLLFTFYGDRPISRYLAHYVSDDGTISVANGQIVAEYIRQIFFEQWARLTADYAAEYNPIENYNLSEHEESSNTASGTDTATDSYTNYKETSKLGHTVTSTTDADTYGFNSSSAVNADTSTNTSTFGAAGDTGDTLEITGTKQNSLLHGKVDTYERDLTRSGNIGVKTATDMIISDVDFWGSHNFFEQICADIASILTIPVYE